MIAGLLAAAARLVAGSTVRWTTAPPDARQRVYVANHTSHFDFVVVWSYLPPATRRLTRPVAARDYWGRGRLRRYLAEHIFRAVLIDRGVAIGASAMASPKELGQRAVADMLAGLDKQFSLILFPEGTRGSGEVVAPFRSGLYHLCRERPGLEVLPVYIDNLNRILPKGEVLPVPMLSRVTFGAALRLEDGEDKAAFLERARQAVCALQAG